MLAFSSNEAASFLFITRTEAESATEGCGRTNHSKELEPKTLTDFFAVVLVAVVAAVVATLLAACLLALTAVLAAVVFAIACAAAQL